MLIAHRGESLDAPENTLSAVRLAWQRGADAVEVDVQLCGDGRVVVMHDSDARRLTRRRVTVRRATLAELKSLDIGRHKGEEWANERIPELSEVLATVPKGKRLFIELKSGREIVEPLARELSASELAPEQIVIISFDLEAMKAVKRDLGAYATALLCRTRWKPRTLGWGRALGRFIARARRAGLDALDIEFRPGIDADLVRSVKAAGLGLYVYTVNDPEAAARLFDAGVDGITSDSPHRLASALQDR